MVTPEIGIGTAWLERVSQGDEYAFTRLVTECSPPVFHFLQRMLNDTEEAEDLTQETFCEVFKHRKKLKTDGDIMPYVFTIARRKAISHLRWRKVRWIVQPLSDVHENTLAGREPQADERLQEKKMEGLVQQMLAALKPEKRAVVILRFFEEMSYREIAKIMQKPETTVRSIAFRAERELRELLCPYQHLW